MKQMTRGVVLLLVALATPVIYGGEPPRGVAGVDVVVKQRPSDSAVTDARGNFAIEALAAGSYTLTFRARKAENLHHSTSDKVIVAMAYSIKIDGTKHAVNKSRLTSDDLMAGVDVDVDLGPGARIRGQVASGALKNMIWIPREPGSNLPGHWVEEGSAEARAALHHNAHELSVEALRRIQR
jgi:Carboxypeptidase regulatory-like domain